MTIDGANITLTHGALLKNLGLINKNGGFVHSTDNGIFDVVSPNDAVSVLAGARMQADLVWGNTITPTGHAMRVDPGCAVTYVTKPSINSGQGLGHEVIVGGTERQWGGATGIPYVELNNLAAVVPNV